VRTTLPALLAFKVLLAAALLHQGFVAVSGDDFFRDLIAVEWAKRPFLVSTEFDTASALWLPLQFWIHGALLRLVPDPWLVPITVNLTLSLGGLLYLFGIARRLFDRDAGLLTVLLVGMMPWHAWLSISGMAEIPLLFFLGGAFYYLVRWEREPSPAWAVLAALGALGAAMVRPEGWIYAVPFSAQLVAQGIPRRRWSALLAAALPWCFATGWLAFNWVAYGEALHFVELSRRNFQLEAGRYDSFMARLLQVPFLMMVVSPALTLLLPSSLLYAWRRSAETRRFGTLVAAGLGLLVVAGLLGLGTTSAPQRYMVAPLALVAPVIAGWCRHVAFPALGRRLAAVGLVGYVTVSAFFAFQFPREFQDESRVAATLVALREEGLLEPGTLIGSDHALAAMGARDVLTPERALRLYVDHAALRVLSRMPDAFWDGNAASRAAGIPAGVRIIAAKTPALAAELPAAFARIGRVGTYQLHSTNLTRPAIPAPPPLVPTTRVEAEFGHRVRLLGYRSDHWAVTTVVRLLLEWTDVAEPVSPLTVRVRLVRAGVPVAAREYPLGEYVPAGALQGSLEIPVRFSEEFDLPMGGYRLGVSVLDASAGLLPVDGSPEGEREVTLGPVYLIRSKRGVVRDVLTGSPAELGLLTRVLLSL